MLFYFEYYIVFILHYFASMKSYSNNAQNSFFLLILYFFYNKVDILVIKSVGEYTKFILNIIGHDFFPLNSLQCILELPYPLRIYLMIL